MEKWKTFVAALGCACGCTFQNAAIADEPCGAWHQFVAKGEVGVNMSSQAWGRVLAFTEWDGTLVAGGIFFTAGGQTVNHIARWDGGQWIPLTAGEQIGLDSWPVYALTEWNGDLIAGGNFATADGQQLVNGIARWDGAAWHALVSGEQIGVDGEVNALAVWNGDLIAGGEFTTAGGQTVNNIARWDGAVWSPFDTGMDDQVETLAVWNGDLIAGGSFITAGDKVVNRIARWDGTEWHRFASGDQTGMSGTVMALTVWDGNLIAGGSFKNAGGQTVNRVARWDGSAWHPFISDEVIGIDGGPAVLSLAIWEGDLVAGGQFYWIGLEEVNFIVRWDGSAWHTFSSGGQIGVGHRVNSLMSWNGSLVAGGALPTAGGQTVNAIARWTVPESSGPADLDCDGAVGVSDLLVLLGNWGDCEEPPECQGDLNGDQSVGTADLLILLSEWG